MFLSKKSGHAYNPIYEENRPAELLTKKGKKVIRLNQGDPARYFKTPRYLIEAYVRALREGKTFYSSSAGVMELRDAVSERYKRLYDVEISSSSVLVTQGVSEALSFLNAALINDGDKAILFKPYYPQYIPNLLMCGGGVLFGDYEEAKGWKIDADALSRSIRKFVARNGKRIKYMLITNPNNPTGTVLDRKTLEEIVDTANDHGILLVSDEIYDEIVFNGARFTSISKMATGVPHVVLNGASKGFDATGFRIGYMLVPSEDKFSRDLLKRLTSLTTMRLSSNTPAQYALADGMRNEREHGEAVRRMVKEIEGRVNFITGLINRSEYMHAVEPQGAFYVFPKIHMDRLRLKDDKQFTDGLLKEEYVELSRGSGFGARDHVRVVSLAEKGTLEAVVKRMERFCSKHAKGRG